MKFLISIYDPANCTRTVYLVFNFAALAFGRESVSYLVNKLAGIFRPNRTSKNQALDSNSGLALQLLDWAEFSSVQPVHRLTAWFWQQRAWETTVERVITRSSLPPLPPPPPKKQTKNQKKTQQMKNKQKKEMLWAGYQVRCSFLCRRSRRSREFLTWTVALWSVLWRAMPTSRLWCINAGGRELPGQYTVKVRFDVTSVG